MELLLIFGIAVIVIAVILNRDRKSIPVLHDTETTELRDDADDDEWLDQYLEREERKIWREWKRSNAYKRRMAHSAAREQGEEIDPESVTGDHGLKVKGFQRKANATITAYRMAIPDFEQWLGEGFDWESMQSVLCCCERECFTDNPYSMRRRKRKKAEWVRHVRDLAREQKVPDAEVVLSRFADVLESNPLPIAEAYYDVVAHKLRWFGNYDDSVFDARLRLAEREKFQEVISKKPEYLADAIVYGGDGAWARRSLTKKQKERLREGKDWRG